MIDAVMESGKRAVKIMDNMLSFSRKSDTRFARHDMCDLFDKTVELAENDYELKKKWLASKSRTMDREWTERP